MRLPCSPALPTYQSMLSRAIAVGARHVGNWLNSLLGFALLAGLAARAEDAPLYRLTLDAGAHDRSEAIVRIIVPDVPKGSPELRDADGKMVAAQPETDGSILLVVPSLARVTTRS